MPIRNDLTHLPRGTARDGYPASRNPFVIRALAAEWDRQYEEAGLKTKALAISGAGPYRGSMASARCDRQMYYKLRQTMNPMPEPPVPGGYGDVSEWEAAENEYLEALTAWIEEFGESNPSGLSDYWTYWLGQLVHEALQPIVTAMFPGAAETKIDLNTIGIPGSAHSDLQVVVEVDGHPTLVEIKTTNGFSFKLQATTFQGPPQGPRYGAVMQALLSAAAQGIDRIVVLLIALERVGPNLVDWVIDDDDPEPGRFLAEWHYTVEEMQSQIDAEIGRIKRLISNAEHGELPTRELHDPEYPQGAVVINPLAAKAPWTLTAGDQVVDSGTYWGCGYCGFRDRCKRDGA